ncbi:MAG TPA: hypothetical protein ENN79_09010 [Desulfobacteraceae bacterium]|nr:hypothetical protein [Desulfobacteraceae bacterium]
MTKRMWIWVIGDMGMKDTRRCIPPGRDGRKMKKLTRHVRSLYKRRAAIEPIIGHLKNDNGMSKNWLKGEEGDMLNALLCACGYNMRKLIRFLFVPILRWLKKHLFLDSYIISDYLSLNHIALFPCEN